MLLQAKADIGGMSLLPETEALIARMSVEPNDARKEAIDNLISAMKGTGVWDKLDVLYVFAAHNSQAALLNWKGAVNDASLNGSPTFTADRGYNTGLGTGVNGPNLTGLSQYALNSAHFGVWQRTNRQSNDWNVGPDTGASTSYSILMIRDTSNRSQWYINGGSSLGTGGTVTDGSGWFVANRSASNASQVYRNGTSVATSSAPSGSIVNDVLEYGSSVASLGDGGDYSAGSVGASLSGTEQTDFYNAMQAYMTAVGA